MRNCLIARRKEGHKLGLLPHLDFMKVHTFIHENKKDRLRYEEEINDILSRSPFLALDRESEWCLFNCSEKLYEHQPWIDRVAQMDPASQN